MADRTRKILEPVIMLAIMGGLFGYVGSQMGLAHMMNTIMATAHQLLLNTVLFIMAVCVLTGAFGRLLSDFGVVAAIESLLRPLMRPIYNLPGVAVVGALVTFFSDNPAIIALAKDKKFGIYFKDYQLASLVNFGTTFGMGMIVVSFMIGKGFLDGALVGLVGAIVGGIISTRLMQAFCRNHMPPKPMVFEEKSNTAGPAETPNLMMRVLNAVLDGGKSGVELGLAIIPGVLIITTFVLMFCFGPKDPAVGYQGVAFEGVPVLPWLAGHFSWLTYALFGFQSPELIAFPVTSLGAVGAAIGLVPAFIERGLVTSNDIAVFTAMGMCWSGYMSTHTAMLDALGYRSLISRAILSHTIAGICAGVIAHYLFVALVAGGVI
jgi:hypothetical protein